MELIKKTMNVEDANGWYLTQNEKRYWTEDFIDEDTGDPQSVERSETICERGAQLNELLISLLQENGIKTVNVSNIPILGNQEKYMNLWETVLNVSKKGNLRKRSYIVTADSPAAAEAFISEWFEINVEATFELVKVNQVKYNKVIKVYDTEREEYEASGTHTAKWYKSQICAMVDDDESGEETSGGLRNLLVLAFSFENAIQAVKSVMGRDEFDSVYKTFKAVQELNIIDVFLPDESVSYYSNNEL
jgi:DNA-directed RNA polymerase subunit beta